MKLDLVRFRFNENATIGKLAVDGVFECNTLEDVVREPFVKIPGRTAIPAGSYIVMIDWSKRFQRMMPLLLAVPEFQGIRIHPGNTAGDTNGCILVGRWEGDERVGMSRIAFDKLFAKLDAAFSRGQQITIDIVNQRELNTEGLRA